MNVSKTRKQNELAYRIKENYFYGDKNTLEDQPQNFLINSHIRIFPI